MERAEYINAAYNTLESLPSTDELIPASIVGHQLRRRLGGPRWTEFGFRSLKDLLREMQSFGFLEIGETTRGALAVKVAEGQRLLSTREERPARTDQRLLPHVWAAFVIEQPRGERFIHKTTGEIRTGVEERPSPIEDWVPVPLIADDVQRTWAEEFLRKQELSPDPGFADELAAQDWYHKFPLALAQQSPRLASEWNRLRSTFVMDEVRRWCDSNDVRHELVFGRRSHAEGLVQANLVGSRDKLNDARKREIVLEALACASLECLLDVPIPAKYFFDALLKQADRP